MKICSLVENIVRCKLITYLDDLLIKPVFITFHQFQFPIIYLKMSVLLMEKFVSVHLFCKQECASLCRTQIYAPPFFVSPKNCGSNRNSLMVAKLSLNCYLCRTQINPPFFFVSPKNCGSIRKILMIPKLCLNCYNVKIQCIYMKLYITQLIVLPVLRSTMIDLLLQ